MSDFPAVVTMADGADATKPVRVVINSCVGGFGISDAAYEKLIEWGVPVRKYKAQVRHPETGLYGPEPANDGEVIFDRELTPQGECSLNDLYWKHGANGLQQRYWETWLNDNRTHPMLLRLCDELGDAVNGRCAKLKVVDVPSDVEWTIEEYDGHEHVAEVHRTWM